MATNWKIDTSHSEVQFKVKHMMISTVTGNFEKFDATIATEGDDFTTAKASFSAEVNSISTNSEQRDGHLKSGDFFDTENHPNISFTSQKIEKKSTEDYIVYGDLTMRGVTKPVELKVSFGGLAQDPWGNTRAGFEIEGKISRKEFGLSWNAVTEAGGIVVSDEVKMIVNASFIKEQ